MNNLPNCPIIAPISLSPIILEAENDCIILEVVNDSDSEGPQLSFPHLILQPFQDSNGNQISPWHDIPLKSGEVTLVKNRCLKRLQYAWRIIPVSK